jgi:hypothetical protein
MKIFSDGRGQTNMEKNSVELKWTTAKKRWWKYVCAR